VLSALARWWRRRLRAADRTLLWPTICNKTRSQAQALEIFLVHASGDSAWTRDFTPEQALAVVRGWPHGFGRHADESELSALRKRWWPDA